MNLGIVSEAGIYELYRRYSHYHRILAFAQVYDDSIPQSERQQSCQQDRQQPNHPRLHQNNH